MRVLAFRHVHFEHLGLIAQALESRGIRYDYVDWAKDIKMEPPYPIDRADGLIFMGGPMSVNDPLDHIGSEVQVIRVAAERGQKILGVCLGAQLIAKALGARVYKNRVKEIGWYPAFWTEAAKNDLLLAGFNRPEVIFHWHGETFDLPSGAEHLAYSPDCIHQAFRVGENIHGLQFHLEVTPEMIAAWLKEDLMEGDTREVRHAIDPHHNEARLRELAATVFGRWCDGLGK